ncbi:hypothetical protein E3N88_40726 [Mikania micrantha]|uniref:Retrotransposon Copia-like N-terminal domain-containing protein n=1 Tax=Mikania micrantha TaxID=192012 RepID=A0A5N6LNI6_9ASTR|nr:hypothetical protein E3N88_40726 [Mikania micrantha]
MAMLASFTTAEKTNHNSHKFGFTLSSTNYGYWKTMIQPFLITNKLFGYIDGSIPCPDSTITIPSVDKNNPSLIQTNPNYDTWVSNDAHIRMLLMSTISEGAFQHVQGTTSRELWLALERAFAPNTTSREYTLKQKLLRIQMQPNETASAYLTRPKNMLTPWLTLLPTAFSELLGLISDHDYMIKKPDSSSAHAFTTTISRPTSSVPASPIPADTLTTLQQLMAQIDLQVQPQSSSSQAMFASRGRGRGYSQRGRGRNPQHFNNNNTANRGQFPWASNQNMVYSTCNRCGIGHIPSQCPNRDPNTLRSRQLSAHHAAY